VNTFTDLYSAIQSQFNLEEVKRLLAVLRLVVIYPNSPQYRPDIDHLSPLQEAVLDAICSLDKTVSSVAAILTDLADYMSLAFLSPSSDNTMHTMANSSPIPPSQRKHSSVTYIAEQEMHQIGFAVLSRLFCSPRTLSRSLCENRFFVRNPDEAQV
jgi:hypothetical protein